MFLPLSDRNALRMIPFQRVTVALIAINVLVFIVQSVIGPQAGGALYVSMGFIPAEFFHHAATVAIPGIEGWPVPEWATLVTYSFVHADIWHLGGNMLFLWVFGDNIEDALGHWRFVVFYLLGGAAAALAEGALGASPDLPLIGASGATSACLGAYLVLYPRVRMWVLVLMRVPLRLPAYWVIGAWLATQIGFLLFSNDVETAWFAHIGGFVAGALMVIALRPRGTPLFGGGSEA